MAKANSLVCVSEMDIRETPILLAISRATPCKFSVGRPDFSLIISKSRHVTPARQPVPMAFIPASFAAKRAAKRSAEFAFEDA